MLVFWIICSLLIIVALAMVLPGLISKKMPEDLDRNKINRAVYDKKSLELENDLKNDLIDHDQYLIAKSDLERSLLDDIDENSSSVNKSGNKLLPIVILILLPIAAVLTYLQLENGMQVFDPAFQKKLAEQKANQSMGQMGSVEQAIATLEDKIKQEPNNIENLQMLGRSYVVTERFEDAINIYSQANELSNGANPDILISLGEAKGFAAGNKFDQSSKSLFDKALKVDPKNERGLWYAGLAAYQLEDYETSVKHLETLYKQVPDGQADVKSALLKYLNDAQQKAGMEITQVEAPATASPTAITVSVSLDENMSKKLTEKIVNSDTLFIYARAMNGPKMPLALVKMTAGDLPTTVTLDDSVSMIAGMTLSTMDQVEVIARISKSGQTIMQTGDLFGSAQSVETSQSSTVDIVISELAP